MGKVIDIRKQLEARRFPPKQKKQSTFQTPNQRLKKIKDSLAKIDELMQELRDLERRVKK